ncbi:hypothetical protein KY290_016637 [Solanum tuberosum]|uniref:Putative plant transposon protein domain-containing protein n=1 Tax=Solanum tuberosum TaxID=4113 RepID=A0ABQ7V904_SOLTU|nr:hypothetical protein KY284_015912 [Solanum tuberosum]KAH0760564.1 hypothetical protein KY290_016637 [Solanum tuberosum]
MAPNAKNVTGSKWSRKGKTFGSSSGRELVQKFRKKAVQRYGWAWFECQREAKYMGDEYVNEDIRHTLCGVESTAMWERSKDTGRHNTLHFANFNQVARVWLKLVCSVLLPAKHLTEVTRDMVVLVYMLMKGMPINVGAILRQNMMKAEGIEEEAVDMTVAYHPDLMGKIVDVIRTKALDTSHGPVLSVQERQARDDSEKVRSLMRRWSYPLIESTIFLCTSGPAFLEPLDDDEATTNEAMDEEDDADAVNDEATALMVFDRGDEES